MNTNPIKKLTLFSYTLQGKRHSFFVMATYVDGKAKMSVEAFDKMVCHISRGRTISIG